MYYHSTGKMKKKMEIAYMTYRLPPKMRLILALLDIVTSAVDGIQKEAKKNLTSCLPRDSNPDLSQQPGRFRPSAEAHLQVKAKIPILGLFFLK